MKQKFSLFSIFIILIGLFTVKHFTKGEIRENVIENSIKLESNLPKNNQIQEDIQSQNWFTNTQFGFIFETPKRIIEQPFKIPKGTEQYVSAVYSYTLKDTDIAVNYMVMDIKSNEYNLKNGLEGSIRNLVNHIDGSNLTLDFFDSSNDYNDLVSKGHFYYKNNKMNIQGYCLFNNSGRVFTLISSGANTQRAKDKIDRIFNSIKYKNY